MQKPKISRISSLFHHFELRKGEISHIKPSLNVTKYNTDMNAEKWEHFIVCMRANTSSCKSVNKSISKTILPSCEMQLKIAAESKHIMFILC